MLRRALPPLLVALALGVAAPPVGAVEPPVRIVSKTFVPPAPEFLPPVHVNCPRGYVASGWALVRSHPSVGVNALMFRTFVSFRLSPGQSAGGIPIEVQVVCVRFLFHPEPKIQRRESPPVTLAPQSSAFIDLEGIVGFAVLAWGLTSDDDGQPSPDVFPVAAEPTARGWKFWIENAGPEPVTVQMQGSFVQKVRRAARAFRARGSSRASAARRARVVTRVRIGRIERDVAPGQQTPVTARCRGRQAEASMGWRLVPGVFGGGIFSRGRFHFNALNNTVTPQRVTFFPMCLSQRIRR